MASWQFKLIKLFFRVRRVINPPAGKLDVARERADTESMAANFPTRIEFTCTPLEVNQVPAEWIMPSAASADRVILYFHGGSYNSGSLESHRSHVANIAHAAKARLLNIDYRLAPEHPFPAAVEDATASYRWLLENQVEPHSIIVAGDSAGGGLTLVLLVKLRDAQLPLPAAAVCLSPWTDLTCSGASWKANVRKDLMLDSRSILESAQLYVGKADPRTPLASPLYADFTGLPPILIQVGSHELILSDSTGVAERAKVAGVEMTLEVWEEMQHEWQFAANMLPEARQALQHIGQFVESHLG